MKNFFKRFRLSEWLLVFQIIFSIGTLILTYFIGDSIVDVVGLVGSTISAIVLIVVFSYENSKNVKYYELTGQFIFNKLGESFSSFMDFLMSEEYEKMPFNEHNILRSKLIEACETNNYDVKRKISRALPYLHDVDRAMAYEIIEILRMDVHNDRTDIRRRTIEAILTIIQKEPSDKRRKRLANKLFEHLHYHNGDDSYTVVACIECFYFLYSYVYTSDKDKERCMRAFEDLKKHTALAFEGEEGVIDPALPCDMDNIWKALASLSAVRNVTCDGYLEGKKYIDSIFVQGKKFSKLTVIKNLFYTCESFPKCLYSKQSCVRANSKFMMDKIYNFLTNATDQDIFLAMPTVRYFDCVCNNLSKGNSSESARKVITEYFSSDDLLITQTAFDKFAKLLSKDADFAKQTLKSLLADESRFANEESKIINASIEALDEQWRSRYIVESGRLKFKLAELNKASEPELIAIDDMIKKHNQRIKFIGKIKKFKDDHKI
ncbi:MAG: hypothetical protein II980_06840 [Clostridia bacterium]|nr:hypothetical protein [Clostridia bacterium]